MRNYGLNALAQLNALDIPNLLDGKKIIVTGGAGVIGRAMALRFARYGARVAAVDWSVASLRQTQAEATRAGLTLETIVCDVSDDDAVCDLVASCVRVLGGVTTVVNNAVVSLPGDVQSVSAQDFRRALEVNVVGAFHLIRHSIDALRTAGGGSIINTGSSNSTMAERQLAAYCTSKGAILMLTRAVALDYAKDGIRANCLGVGFVDTPFNYAHYERIGGIEKVREHLTDGIPMERGGEPEEIAAAAAWLASDLSSYVTGALIPVDGGLTAGI